MAAGSDIGWYVLLVWTLIWKGFALWRAANKQQKYWFIAMLVLNTAGILEIVYLFVFSKWTTLRKSEVGNNTDEEKSVKIKGADKNLVEKIAEGSKEETPASKSKTSKKRPSSKKKTSA